MIRLRHPVIEGRKNGLNGLFSDCRLTWRQRWPERTIVLRLVSATAPGQRQDDQHRCSDAQHHLGAPK